MHKHQKLFGGILLLLSWLNQSTEAETFGFQAGRGRMATKQKNH